MDLKKQIWINTWWKILFLFLQVIISLIIPRIIGPDGFGLYSLVIANASLLVSFTSLGIPSALTFHAAKGDRDPHQLKRLLFISTGLQLLLIAAFECIYYLIQGHFAIWPSGNYLAALLGISYYVSLVLTEKYFAIYNGYKAFTPYNRITVIFAASMILAQAICLFTGLATTRNILVLTIVISLLQTFFLYMGSKTFFRSGPQAEPGNYRTGFSDFFRYSFRSYLANMFQFLANRVDLWILLYFGTQTDLGLYSLSSRLAQLYLVLPLIFSSVILPAVASPGFRREQLDKQVRLMNSMNLLLAIVGAVISYFFIPFFFGADFTPSIIPFIILIPGMMFKSYITMAATYFAGRGDVSLNMYNSALTVVLVIALDILLIPSYNMVGAALAITLANFFGAVYAWKKYVDLENLKGYRLFATSEDLEWMRAYSRQVLLSFRSK